MIVRDSVAASFLVQFPSGNPDGNITWEVRGPDASVISSGTVVVPVDALSAVITIDGTYNSLPSGALFSYRDVSWSYTVGGIVQNDERRYSIEARLPFGVSADGVRSKLGVDAIDLPNDEIELVKGYLSFQSLAGGETTLNAASDGGIADLSIRDAIEATAALLLIPTMSVRVAVKEASASNSFQRQPVDWFALASFLEGTVTTGLLAVNPLYDATANFGAMLVLASPSIDPFTDAAPAKLT